MKKLIATVIVAASFVTAAYAANTTKTAVNGYDYHCDFVVHQAMNDPACGTRY